MKSDVGGGWRQEVVMMEIEHQVFAANEIDFDYEFDAARFFDLSAQETPVQTRQAELWFETAGSYAPSRSLPFNHFHSFFYEFMNAHCLSLQLALLFLRFSFCGKSSAERRGC